MDLAQGKSFSERIALRRVTFMALLALGLFGWLFVPAHFRQPGFWSRMAASVAILNLLALALDRAHSRLLRADLRAHPLQKTVLGLVSAIALYFVFLAGYFATRFVLPFAGAEISSIYAQKETARTAQIVLFLALVIGPGEEIFWRAYLQRNITQRTGKAWGLGITTALYGLAHVFSGNFMLVTAALVAGAFWGWMYNRFESPLANAVSHTAWDLLVFVLLPFGA